MERKLREKLPEGKFVDVELKHTRIMKGVLSKGNYTTEARFRVALMSAGLSGWRQNVREAKGTPDFYFFRERLAVFIDGCFWHGCTRCGHIPKKNRPFWKYKIDRNRERDFHNTATLRNQGISVLRFWEHEVANSPKSCALQTARRLIQRKRQSLGRYGTL